MKLPPFDTVNPVTLDVVATRLGFAFMTAGEPVLRHFADDEGVPPDAFHAAIVKAHLSGAVAARVASNGPEGDARFIADATLWMTAEIAALRDARAAAHAFIHGDGTGGPPFGFSVQRKPQYGG